MELQINNKAVAIFITKMEENKNKSFLLGTAAKEEEILFRIKMFQDQELIAFPKFSSIAISFLIEEDWNTNLPYKCDEEEIYDHIKCNKKYKEIKKKDCIKAIIMLKAASQVLETLIKGASEGL